MLPSIARTKKKSRKKKEDISKRGSGGSPSTKDRQVREAAHRSSGSSAEEKRKLEKAGLRRTHQALGKLREGNKRLNDLRRSTRKEGQTHGMPRKTWPSSREETKTWEFSGGSSTSPETGHADDGPIVTLENLDERRAQEGKNRTRKKTKGANVYSEGEDSSSWTESSPTTSTNLTLVIRKKSPTSLRPQKILKKKPKGAGKGGAGFPGKGGLQQKSCRRRASPPVGSKVDQKNPQRDRESRKRKEENDYRSRRRRGCPAASGARRWHAR